MKFTLHIWAKVDAADYRKGIPDCAAIWWSHDTYIKPGAVFTCIAILSLFFSSLLFCIVGSWWRPARTGSLVIASVIDKRKFWMLWVATIKSQMAVGHCEEKSIQRLFIREKKWWHPRCNVFSQPYSGHREWCTLNKNKVKRNTIQCTSQCLLKNRAGIFAFDNICFWK